MFRFLTAPGSPQLVGSDIHISMGEIELDAVEPAGAGLRGRLSRFGRCGSLYFRIPAGRTLPGAEPLGDGVARLPVTLDGREITIAP